jgi:signal transduction histidine kinase
MASAHTLLVVDDEPDVVKSIKDLFRLDYRVLGTTRPTEALEILGHNDVHVVLTDQRMPETSGVEFLAKTRVEHPETIRLLMTGYADIRTVIDAINQGHVYRYITKPWDPDELQAIIKDAVERYDLIAERRSLVQQLQQSNAALQQSDELKTAFIRVASHELRSPMTILIGAVRLAQKTPCLDELSQQWLGRIDRAANRLGHLVDELVTMLELGRFDQTLDRKPTDLAELINQAADDVRPFVEQRHQQLTVQTAPDLGAASIDGGKIRDALNHLLVNAIKFTPDGGKIALTGRRADRSIELSVSDSGVGIDPTNLSRIFQPFFTGFDVSRHSSGIFEFGKKGLGLGLSVVKAFVQMHDGHVSVQSVVSGGTTFTIRLPVSNGT